MSMTNEKISIVSFEEAARIIENERKNDDSEFMEGGFDPGTSLLDFLLEDLSEKIENEFEKKEMLFVLIEKAELLNLWNICRLEELLSRGIKFLSTGEMKKALLCKSFLLLVFKKVKKVHLVNIYEGLDKETVQLLKNIENSYVFKKRFSAFVEFENKKPLDSLKIDNLKNVNFQNSNEIQKDFQNILFEQANENKSEKLNEKKELVRMEKVRVAWSGVEVLKNINWTVYEGEHCLILGPNGCGKTTLLELITGDNQQAYSNDLWIFGKKRGSGESIWDIKKQLGIVSYKLHLEYRLLGAISVLKVLLSGFYDSIGLYDAPLESEIKKVQAWLSLFEMRDLEKKDFGKLSYGMQRAVLILRALIKSPPLLILDEPCHALSESERSFVLALIEKIALHTKTTILHVTHDENEFLDCEKKIFRFLPNTPEGYRIERR